jgi:hypothetical protein
MRLRGPPKRIGGGLEWLPLNSGSKHLEAVGGNRDAKFANRSFIDFTGYAHKGLLIQLSRINDYPKKAA